MSAASGKGVFRRVSGRVLDLLSGKPTALRRLYICEGPHCYRPDQSKAAFKALKRGLKEAGLDSGEDRVKIRRVECLGVCGEGPIATLCPGDIWFYGLREENAGKFISNRLVEGIPLKELEFSPPPEARSPEKPGL